MSKACKVLCKSIPRQVPGKRCTCVYHMHTSRSFLIITRLADHGNGIYNLSSVTILIVHTCKDAGRAQWGAAQNLSPEKLTVIHSSGTIGLLARARNKLNKFRHPVGNPAYFGAPKSSTASLTQHFACPAAGDSFHDMASIMKIMIYTVTDMHT